jgi:hypothetical protein
MSRDVFVWLLAVALIGRNIWLADRHSQTDEQRGYLWSRELVVAWWEAERARWTEEEARQDAIPLPRPYHQPDESAGAEPPEAPELPPDCSPEEEAARLTPWRGRPKLKLYRYVRLGPRGEDLFVATTDDRGEPDSRFW